MKADRQAVEDRVIQTVRSLCDALPADICSLRVDRPDPRTVVLTVAPTNAKAAGMEVRFERDSGIYLALGAGSVFEIPLEGKRYTKFDLPEELEQLCKAVINGRFTEYVVRSSGKVIGATGELLPEKEGQPIKESWMKLGLGLFKKKERTTYRYEPYTS